MDAAHSSSTPCVLQDAYTEVAWTDEVQSLSFSRLLALITVAIHVDEWLTQELHLSCESGNNTVMTWTDETFLPCGSPYCSNHWIWRSMRDFCPCCRYWEGRLFMVRVFNSFVYHFELTHVWNKSCKYFWHDVWQIQIQKHGKFTANLSMWGSLRAIPKYFSKL